MNEREYNVTYIYNGKEVTWLTRNVDAIANRLITMDAANVNITIKEIKY